MEFEGMVLKPARNNSELLRRCRELLVELEAIVADEPSNPPPGLGRANSSPEVVDRGILKNLASEIYRTRRVREKNFGVGLFSDPAWDILLDLYIHKEKRAISVSSACHGAAVPPTTALRWLAVLENANLLSRSVDPRDGRRTFLSLTAEGETRMECVLTSMSVVPRDVV